MEPAPVIVPHVTLSSKGKEEIRDEPEQLPWDHCIPTMPQSRESIFFPTIRQMEAMSQMEPALEKTFHYFGLPIGGTSEEIEEEKKIVLELAAKLQVRTPVAKGLSACFPS